MSIEQQELGREASASATYWQADAAVASATELPTLATGERLLSGIWPRSLALWMAAFYISLFILRPWEQSFLTWLNDIHFERLYAISMIVAALFSLLTSRATDWASPRWGAPTDYQNAAVLLFISALGLSTLFAPDFDLAWDKFYMALTIVAFYFVLRIVVRSPYELMFMVTCYIVAMALYMLKAQWEYFMYGRRDYTMGVTRLIGIETSHGGPNGLAISIVVSLPLWYLLFSNRKYFSATWSGLYRKFYASGLLIYLGLAICSLIMTRSRAGFVTFVVFLMLMVLRTKGIGRKVSACLGGLLVLVVLWFSVSDEARSRIRTIWNPEEGRADAYVSAMGRVEGFRAGIEMFRKHPLTGIGPGNFVPYRVDNVDGVPLEAHNLVGQVLGEVGILGALALVLMVAVTLLNCRRVRQLTTPGHELGPQQGILYDFATACRDTILLLIFEGLFDHNMMRFNWLWLAAFACVALRCAAVKAGETDWRQGFPLRMQPGI